MTWTRLSDDLMDRPVVLTIGRSARLLHVEALVWCNRHLTDGVLPAGALRRISDSDDVERDVAELAKADLWESIDEGTWQVQWADQETAEKVESRRTGRNARQRNFEERRALHAGGDHSKCFSSSCRYVAKTSPDASGATSDDALPSRPAPDPEGGGKRGGGGSTSSDGSAALAASSAPPPTGHLVGGQRRPVLAGPPPGVIPTIDGVPAWGPSPIQEGTP